MSQFVTVVYAINDMETFKEQQENIAKLHKAYRP